MDHRTTQAPDQSSVTPAERPPRHFAYEACGYGARMVWGNFHKIVFYGPAWEPSYSYWIVPGTITSEEQM